MRVSAADEEEQEEEVEEKSRVARGSSRSRVIKWDFLLRDSAMPHRALPERRAAARVHERSRAQGA
jgi:hypothetical protein